MNSPEPDETTIPKTTKRNFLKCQKCRHDRQACLPLGRNWDVGERCERCLKSGRPCGPPQRAERKSRKKDVAMEEPTSYASVDPFFQVNEEPWHGLSIFGKDNASPLEATARQKRYLDSAYGSFDPEPLQASSAGADLLQSSNMSLRMCVSKLEIIRMVADIVVKGVRRFDRADQSSWRESIDLQYLLIDCADRLEHECPSIDLCKITLFVRENARSIAVCIMLILTDNLDVEEQGLQDGHKKEQDFGEQDIAEYLKQPFSAQDILELLEGQPNTTTKQQLIQWTRMWQGDGSKTPTRGTVDSRGPAQVVDHVVHYFDAIDDLVPKEIEPIGQSGEQKAMTRMRLLIPSTNSFQWLISTLHNAVMLDVESLDAQKHIRNVILSEIPTRPASAGASVSTVSFTFSLSRGQAGLIEENTDPGSVLSVTGSFRDAQVTTCAEYFGQVWPVTGEDSLNLLRHVLSGSTSKETRIQRSDKTVMTASSENGSITVEVVGVTSVIAEVAAQLCWLVATLKPWHSTEGITCCSPTLRCTSRDVNSKIGISSAGIESMSLHDYQADDKASKEVSERVIWKQETPKQIAFQFAIDVHYDQVAATTGNGSCWHKFFEKCTIIAGFPIRRRREPFLGLELSLNVMTWLAGTKKVQKFSGLTFIKSFSLLLAPVRLIADTLVWHLTRSIREEPLSYHTHDRVSPCKISLQNLAVSRHIVGWCSSVDVYCGAKDGEYGTEQSNLPTVDSAAVLHGCDITFGIPISGGESFVATSNHRPYSIPRKKYIDLFRFLENRSVLFWDVRDRRGWLVNGLQALLHLLRQSLMVDKSENSEDIFVLRDMDLEEPQTVHTDGYARDFLSNAKNLRTRISLSSMEADHEEYELLADRMQDFFEILEKAFEYQNSCNNWSVRPRSQLEGWDFISLARKDDPIEPNVSLLPSVANTWIDMARALGAITLFGEGFGDMLRPRGCGPLPRDEYYIAATVPSICRFIKRNRCDPRKAPRMISRTPPVLWHSPQTSLVSGCCEKHYHRSIPKHVIQIVWPKEHAELLPSLGESSDLHQHMQGAYIFGHNSSLKFYIPNLGPPVEGVPSHSVKELESFEDSAIDIESQDSGRINPFSHTTKVPHSPPLYSMPQSDFRGHSFGRIDQKAGYGMYGTVNGNVSLSQYYILPGEDKIGSSTPISELKLEEPKLKRPLSESDERPESKRSGKRKR